jgi:phage terminase small subunit
LLELTPKQEAFARVYVQTGNATEAYRGVYSDRCSRQTAEGGTPEAESQM